MAIVTIKDPESKLKKLVRAYGVPAAGGAALGLSSLGLASLAYGHQLSPNVKALMVGIPTAVGTSVLGTARAIKALRKADEPVKIDTRRLELINKVASILRDAIDYA